MSEENVELVRRSFDLWTRGDLEGFLETIDPAIQAGHLHPPAPGCFEPRPRP
jgi:ketosteroid isomerase-like protein